MWQLGAKTAPGKLCSANTPRKVQTSGKLIWCARRINGSPSSLPAAVCDPRLACAPVPAVFQCDSVPSESWEASAGLENPSNCQWWVYHHIYQSLWKHRQWRGGKRGNKAAQHNQWIGFPGMGVLEGAPEGRNFWQIHCNIRYCQRQHPRMLRGLKAQQISCCALISCTLITSEGRGDFSRSHSLSTYGATKSRMITRTVSLEVLLQRIITIIQLIRIVLFRARVSEHFAGSITFPPHPWRRSIIHYT